MDVKIERAARRCVLQVMRLPGLLPGINVIGGTLI